MKTCEEMKAEIDGMTYEQLLQKWRFSSIGAPLFQGEVGEYFTKVLNLKKNELSPEAQASISKSVGWNGCN